MTAFVGFITSLNYKQFAHVRLPIILVCAIIQQVLFFYSVEESVREEYGLKVTYLLTVCLFISAQSLMYMVLL